MYDKILANHTCTYLQNKKITIRFERSNPADIIVYYKDQRIGPARRLDLIANSKIKRSII